jgi:glycosyltransferase involved in cell wall biosynthesis
MWELACYPREWARELEEFDEVWAASAFIRDSIAPAVSRPVLLLPTPVGLPAGFGIGRRRFRIPETSYAFLFAFDLRSYTARKNPQAVIEAFRRVVRDRPAADCTLVLKVGGTAARPESFSAFKSEFADLGGEHSDRVVLVEGDLTAAEITSLLWVCDAFVSLHRSEGFGRLLGEAMLMGKPVIATAYSGNVDFMTPDDSLLVPYRLVPVPDGAYPFAAGQSWAEPDVDEAVRHMLRLLDDPAEGRRIGERASRRLRVAFGHRAAGLRYAERVRAAEERSGTAG